VLNKPSPVFQVLAVGDKIAINVDNECQLLSGSNIVGVSTSCCANEQALHLDGVPIINTSMLGDISNIETTFNIYSKKIKYFNGNVNIGDLLEKKDMSIEDALKFLYNKH